MILLLTVFCPALSLPGGANGETSNIWLQLFGAGAMAVVMAYIAVKETIHLPLGKLVGNDHELQVFAALCICLGLSLLTGLAQLSTALGAFVGGMVIGAAKETQWVHHSLESFRIVSVALFFCFHWHAGRFEFYTKPLVASRCTGYTCHYH